jgi:ribonucleotide monophosphatase NagD (HAD superfamily)
LFAFSTGKLCLRPGLLTLRYQQLGGAVLNFGKPFPEIFQQGLKILNYPKRVLMVGDTEYTDIQGAARHNIDTMLITKLNKDDPIRSQAMYFSQEVKW